MEEQIVSFETAKSAKEVGFYENCLHFYTKPRSKMYGVDEKGRYYPIKNTSKKMYTCGEHAAHGKENVMLAPTQSLLQKWLREKHYTNIVITLDSYRSYKMMLYVCRPRMSNVQEHFINWELSYYTYEEALEKGLQEALKLIKENKKL